MSTHQLRKQFFVNTCLFLIITLSVIGWLIFGRGTSINVIGIAILTPILLISICVNGYRIYKRQESIWKSIRIDVGEYSISRNQLNLPEIRISRKNVTQIKETNQGLMISTANKFRSLVVPNALDQADYDEIKNTLSAWTPIQAKSKSENTKIILLLFILLGGFGVVLFSKVVWLVLIVSVMMLAIYGYYYWLLSKDKGTDPGLKRSLFIGIIFLAFIAVGRLSYLLDLFSALVP
jgi:hypothetical protein